MTKPQVRDLKAMLERLAAFYPQVVVGQETIAAYESRMRGFNSGAVERVLTEWVDREDHWPAWSELRDRLRTKVPKSLSDQQRPPFFDEIEATSDPDEAKTILESHAESARKREEKRSDVAS